MEWLEPWYSIKDNPEQVLAMEKELKRELPDGHPLFNLPIKAIGRRQGCDDALFSLADGTKLIAVVHLTWTSSPPERLPWPITVVYPSIETWASEGMSRDHDEMSE